MSEIVEKNPEIPAGSDGAPFRGKLLYSDLGEKIKELKDNPDLLVREQSLNFYNIDSAISYFNDAKNEFEKIQKNYGIAVPKFQCVVGKPKNGKRTMYTIIERINGSSLRRMESLPNSARDEIDLMFASMTRYYRDAYQNGGKYWMDFHDDNIVFGRRAGEEKDRIYLTDVDPFILEADLKDPHSREIILRRFMIIANDIAESEKKFSGNGELVLAREEIKKAMHELRDDDKRNRIVETMRRDFPWACE